MHLISTLYLGGGSESLSLLLSPRPLSGDWPSKGGRNNSVRALNDLFPLPPSLPPSARGGGGGGEKGEREKEERRKEKDFLSFFFRNQLIVESQGKVLHF